MPRPTPEEPSAQRSIPWRSDAFWSDSVYLDLRRLAGLILMQRRTGDSLSVTLLVQDAFVRLANSGASVPEGGTSAHRPVFFALMRRCMRSVHSDWIRRRTSRARASPRGASDQPYASRSDPLLGLLAQAEALAEALTRLHAINPRAARVAELRFVRGMSVAQVANAINVSQRTVELDWVGAKAWLKREITISQMPRAGE